MPPFYRFKRQGNTEKIITASRTKYARKREEVEKRNGKTGALALLQFKIVFVVKISGADAF